MNMEAFYAGGFFYNPKKNEVLLHKRDGNTEINPHKWTFFGGGSEGMETPLETFIREIEEELSVRVSKEEAVPLCDYVNEERDIRRHVFYVVSEKLKSEMILGEGADFDWVPLSRVFEYDLSEKTVRDLKLFLSKI